MAPDWREKAPLDWDILIVAAPRGIRKPLFSPIPPHNSKHFAAGSVLILC